MTELEILDQSISKLFLPMLFSFMGTIIGFIFGLCMWEFKKVRYGGLLVGSVSVIVLIITASYYLPQAEKYDELIEERNDLRDQQLKTMSCDDLRLDILDIMENDKPKYIEKTLEWEKDYYYTKCEIPLREEIMKLQ